MVVRGPLPISSGRLARAAEAAAMPAQEADDARARIAAALVAPDIGTWLWDIRLDAVRGDANLNAMFGLSSPTGSSRPISDYLAAIHPDDRGAVWSAISQAIADGNSDFYEAQYRLIANGVERWVHAQGLVRRNDIGVATDLSGVVRDISQQKLLDAQRRQLLDAIDQQARIFNAAMTSVRDFVYVFNPDGRVEYVNQRLLDLWDLTIHQAVGKDLYELGYPEELAAKLHHQIREVVETGTPITDETTYTSPAGEEGYYEYTFLPVFARDGTVEFVGGSARIKDRGPWELIAAQAPGSGSEA